MDTSTQVRVAGVTRIEESDVAEALRQFPSTPVANVVALGVFAVLAVVSLFVRAALMEHRTLHLLVQALSWHFSIALVLVLLVIGAVRSRAHAAKRAWGAMQEWERQVRYELTDTSMRIRTESSSQELDWTLYAGWQESLGAFYLKQPDNKYLIIPKRAFENEAELAQVRELLRSKVSADASVKTAAHSTRRTLLLWLLLIALCAAAYLLLRTGPSH